MSPGNCRKQERRQRATIERLHLSYPRQGAQDRRATLLAEAHHAIQGRDYHALRRLTGVAPVTKRSAKSRRVEMRQACSNRLRTAVYHLARVATQHDAGSRTRYAALRARGHSHGRALRTVADRLLGIACVMLENRTPYDPKHEAARAGQTT